MRNGRWLIVSVLVLGCVFGVVGSAAVLAFYMLIRCVGG
jgi:hypothetical protein